MSVRFTQSCPTCGRRIQIRASLLGCIVACQHCHAEFVAEPGLELEAGSEEASPAAAISDPLMARVEELLARADRDAAIS